MDKKLYTIKQLKNKYSGKYIDVYPLHYEVKNKAGVWITVFEVRKVSSILRENCNLPQDIERDFCDYRLK